MLHEIKGINFYIYDTSTYHVSNLWEISLDIAENHNADLIIYKSTNYLLCSIYEILNFCTIEIKKIKEKLNKDSIYKMKLYKAGSIDKDNDISKFIFGINKVKDKSYEELKTDLNKFLTSSFDSEDYKDIKVKYNIISNGVYFNNNTNFRFIIIPEKDYNFLEIHNTKTYYCNKEKGASISEYQFVFDNLDKYKKANIFVRNNAKMNEYKIQIDDEFSNFVSEYLELKCVKTYSLVFKQDNSDTKNKFENQDKILIYKCDNSPELGYYDEKTWETFIKIKPMSGGNSRRIIWFIIAFIVLLSIIVVVIVVCGICKNKFNINEKYEYFRNEF